MGVLHNGLAIGSCDSVVDIEGAARLDLDVPNKRHFKILFHYCVIEKGTTYSKVECNLCSWLVHLGEEAGVFACDELVSEGSG